MKVVEYERTLQWVGTLECPSCHKTTEAWRSSGMSQCFPHFYCDRCSNVIHRQADQALVWNGATEEILENIRNSLPECGCGGHFRPGTNPKCKYCGTEFKHQDAQLKRLSDPFMIVTDGSVVYSDKNEPYQVRIIPENHETNPKSRKKIFGVF